MPTKKHEHEYVIPNLALRSGKQAFFCLRCGTVRPTPDKGPCILPGNLVLYEELHRRRQKHEEPLRADEVILRLAEAVRRVRDEAEDP